MARASGARPQCRRLPTGARRHREPRRPLPRAMPRARVAVRCLPRRSLRRAHRRPHAGDRGAAGVPTEADPRAGARRRHRAHRMAATSRPLEGGSVGSPKGDGRRKRMPPRRRRPRKSRWGEPNRPRAPPKPNRMRRLGSAPTAVCCTTSPSRGSAAGAHGKGIRHPWRQGRWRRALWWTERSYWPRSSSLRPC